jgi:hypothetical protein
MIDLIATAPLVAQADMPQSRVEVQEKTRTQEESGFIHSKEGGRFQIVKTLPKKAEDFDHSFDYADAFGVLRIAGIYSDLLDGIDTSAVSVGGQFGFQTASYHGVSARLGAYTSQKVSALTDSDKLNQDYFDENGNSFTYIAEANVAYDNEFFQVKGGRVRIDTPYADSDDIRMAPNTFEGVWSHFDFTDEWKAQAMYLTRWAGFDSGEDQNEFKKFFKNPKSGEMSNGLLGVSLSYVIDDVNDVSLWYYHVDKMCDIAYAEAAGDIVFSEDLHIEYGLQGSVILESSSSGVDGEVLGAMALLHYDMVYGGAAFNYAFVDDGNYIVNGFGGGPYYTSLDESTIGFVSGAVPGEDVSSYRLGAGVDFSSWGPKGLVMEYIYGDLESEESASFSEQDIMVSYEITDKLYFEGTFAHFNIDKSKIELDADEFDRYIVRMDYSF